MMKEFIEKKKESEVSINRSPDPLETGKREETKESRWFHRHGSEC